MSNRENVKIPPMEVQINEDDLFVFAKVEHKKSEQIKTAPYSYWKSVWRNFIKRPAAIIGITLLILFIIGMIVFTATAYEGATIDNTYKANLRPFTRDPKYNHFLLLGSDKTGRDIFASIWQGAGKSLTLALISSSIIVTIGTIFGLIWGFFRKLDRIFIEIYNLISNIPSLLLYILLASIIRKSAPYLAVEVKVVISLTVLGWVGLSLFIRNQVIIITNREYNIASKTLGTPASRIMTKNLLPYILPVLITQASLIIPGMISSEVSLNYFGVGLKAEAISIGALLNGGIANFSIYPEQLLAPAAMLGLIILIFFVIGLALSDSLDPKTHR